MSSSNLTSNLTIEAMLFPAELFQPIYGHNLKCYGRLEEPPKEKVSIGNQYWTEDNGESYFSCKAEWFVLPDGSAECVTTKEDRHTAEKEEGSEKFEAGTWVPVEHWVTSGSWSGRHILRRKPVPANG